MLFLSYILRYYLLPLEKKKKKEDSFCVEVIFLAEHSSLLLVLVNQIHTWNAVFRGPSE